MTGTRVWKVCAFLLFLLGGGEAFGQEYRFAVPECEMHVHVQESGDVRIVYDFAFRNEPGAHPIDVVDVGMPHKGYDMSTMKASCRGRALTDIRHSQYVMGVEVHLGTQTIDPGERGIVHFECVMPRMLYQDTTREDYASLQITPTWFGAKYVVGSTDLTIAIHLPPGVEKEEVLYQNQAISRKEATDAGVVVYWDYEGTRLVGPHKVGVSFPKRVVDRVITVTNWELFREWFIGSTRSRWVAAILAILLLGFLYFRFTGGTAVFPFVVLLWGLGVLFVEIEPLASLYMIPPLVGLVALNEWYLRTRKREYLPAIASVEGGGIKRGLTVAEAAVLLERPLHEVLGLVLYGMFKKTILRQTNVEPLRVEITPPFRTSEDSTDEIRERNRRKAGEERGIPIREVELAILAELEPVLEEDRETPFEDVSLERPLEGLIERTVERLEGFDLEETRTYYRRIVERALTEARTVVNLTEEQRQAALEPHVEWVLLHEDPEERRRAIGGYRPVWLGSAGGSLPSGSGAGSGSGGGASVSPSLTDVASSFAGWTENTFGQLAGAVSPDLYTTPTGVVDLSAVDRALNSGSSGGSSGGGCACACAGCACACACAGGGR